MVSTRTWSFSGQTQKKTHFNMQRRSIETSITAKMATFIFMIKMFSTIFTGLRTHSVGGQLVTVAGVCHRRQSGSVTLHGRPAGCFTCVGQAMTSCYLQSNYSSTATLHGGPVVLRPVRATSCFTIINRRQPKNFVITKTPTTPSPCEPRLPGSPFTSFPSPTCTSPISLQKTSSITEF